MAVGEPDYLRSGSLNFLQKGLLFHSPETFPKICVPKRAWALNKRIQLDCPLLFIQKLGLKWSQNGILGGETWHLLKGRLQRLVSGPCQRVINLRTRSIIYRERVGYYQTQIVQMITAHMYKERRLVPKGNDLPWGKRCQLHGQCNNYPISNILLSTLAVSLKWKWSEIHRIYWSWFWLCSSIDYQRFKVVLNRLPCLTYLNYGSIEYCPMLSLV